MKWISITLPITMDIPVYKNLEDKKPSLEVTRNFQQHGVYESALHLPLHTGTHVDYPLHAIEGGKTSTDYQVFPATFKGMVLDLTMDVTEYIGIEHVKDLDLSGVEALFFKTIEAPLKTFDFEFPWLEKGAAAWISKLPLKFVGIDQPGIERNQPGHETHIQLLKEDILIIEGLDLTPLTTGVYDFVAVTLQLKNVEAEPVVVYVVVQ
jgi:arylformamidase